MNEIQKQERAEVNRVTTQNKYGEWVPAIPEPYYGIKKHCVCGEKFWTKRRYQEHYALEHILAL